MYITYIKPMNCISDEERLNFLHVAALQLQKWGTKIYIDQKEEQLTRGEQNVWEQFFPTNL